MRQLIGTTVFLLLTIMAYGQTFSYSFKGELDKKSLTTLELESAQLPQVNWTKCRYKEDKKAGELIICINEEISSNGGGDDQEFTVVDVKRLLISKGLQPLDLIELPTK